MKKILSFVFIFCSLSTFAQDKKMEISTFTTKSGETITDTIWYKMQYLRKLNTVNGEYYIDSAWTIEAKTNNKKRFTNPVIPAVQKGNVSIGTWINRNENNSNAFRIGYFTSDNFMLGAGLAGNYDFDFSDFESFNVNLFIRNYFGRSNNSKLFIDAGLDADLVNEEIGFGINFGKTIFIGSNFGVDLGIGYKTNFETGGGITFGLGFQGIIPTKK